MKRLIYSPKVYVFIRSRSRDGKIFDVSDYVTSGSISRNMNAPSTAEFTLKNRFFMFSANKNEPLFMPMDGVTIWMQRIAGRPIQVFTGYLDSVPYFQLYPADAPFTATCTLKRLKHTYFDPGVKATMDFFQKHNWTLTPDGANADFSAQLAPLAAGGVVTDGGLGVLLKDFMTEIGGWNSTAVMVSDIPRDLTARAANLYSKLQAGAAVQRDQLEAVLKGLVSLQANNNLTTTGMPAIDNVKTMMKAASTENVDPWLMIMSGLVLSGLQPNHAVEDETAPNFGYGVFALSPVQIGGVQSSDMIEGYSLVSTNTNSIFKIPNSVKAFLKRIRQNVPDPQLRVDWQTQPYTKTAELIAAASGHTESKALIQAAVETNADLVKQYMGAANNVNYDAQTVSTERPFAYWNIDTASLDSNVTWARVEEEMTETYTEDEQQVLSTANYQRLKNRYSRAAAFAHVGLQTQYNLVPIAVHGNGSETLLVMSRRNTGSGSVRAPQLGSNSRSFYNWASSQTTNRGRIEVWYRNTNTATSTSEVLWSKNGRPMSSPPDIPQFNMEPGANSETVIIRMTDDDNPIDPPYYDGHPIFSNNATPTQDNTATQTDFKFSDLLKMSFASAFATQFSFPANFLESQLLSGERSLMNDITVLDGVDRLCKASMRNYMSLPSGEFIAFFPDYFGSFERKPYWSILDTEIINLGINLSDANLVTHAFVTGGTITPGEINFINKSLSLGVVSVEQVFNTEDFISGGAAYFAGGKIKRDGNNMVQILTNANLRAEDNQALSAAFLGTYGLRPMSVENPLIRSNVVEFLYAWQLFMYQWAAQFATRAEFTFMPELMAGGRISLPDHELELYLESVTHSWSYTDGFTTSATVMAPQSTKTDKWPGLAMASGLSGFGSISTGGIG